MRHFLLNHIAILTVLVFFSAAAGRLEGKSKGGGFEKEAIAAESRQDYDRAVDWYERALSTRPGDVGYTLSLRRVRAKAAEQHLAQGRKLRAEGKLEGAVEEFRKATALDGSSAIAVEEWVQTAKLAERAQGRKLAPDELLSPVERAKKNEIAAAAAMRGTPQLKAVIPNIPSLKMHNQPARIVYETICKLAGVNVIFDPQFAPQARNLDIELANTVVDQALDHVALLTKTFWKPISATTVFVTDDNPTKRRDYEDNVARVFYIQNTTSVQEFQELATAVRSLSEIRRVFTYNAQRAILVRGTPDQVALAGRLIQDLDKPKAEVVVDVIVMQANSSRTRTLAAQIASSTGGLRIPVSFTPRNAVTTTSDSSSSSSTTSSSTTTSAVSLANLGRISSGDFATTLPGALLNLVMSDSRTRVLQSPQVRASDGQKVTLKIGQKVPYATGSYSGLTATTVSSLVSTQFQYADVGVNVDITPQVHGLKEVTLKVAVELSSVASHVTISGVEQPVIAQQRNETEIRMREGEVNILSGALQSSDSKSTSGIPGLTSVPVLGRVLGGETTDRERSELLIALVPHVVRVPEYSETDLREVATGTDQIVKVSYTPVAALVEPTREGSKPEVKPKPVEHLGFGPEAIFIKSGRRTTVVLHVPRGGTRPIRLKFDSRLVRLEDLAAEPGALKKDIRNTTGEAFLELAPGGDAEVAISFSALAAGKGSLTAAAVPVGEFSELRLVVE